MLACNAMYCAVLYCTVPLPGLLPHRCHRATRYDAFPANSLSAACDSSSCRKEADAYMKQMQCV